jgi:broad specificity phosphatase PhoE
VETQKELLLVRHGEVEGWRPGMLLGTTDLSLSANGRRQAALIQELVPAGSAARFVSSPLARTRQTAEIVLAGREVVLETDGDLREVDFGQWEGLTYADVQSRFPLLAGAWSRADPDFAFPGGEKLGDFVSRTQRAARRLIEADAPAVAAFTHGGVIRVLICHFLGLPLRNYLLFDVTPGSVTTLRVWGERGVLTGLWSPETLSALCRLSPG